MEVKRNFFLGSEWLYYKIYAGIGVQEKILKNEIFEIVKELYSEKIIDKFFFIRYQDEIGYHLRLRFHLLEKTLYPHVIDRMYLRFDKYLDTRVIYSITNEVYKRELERYGALNIEHVESLFCLDSWKIINYLRIGKKNWHDILPLVDQIFDSFSFSSAQRYKIIEELYQDFNTRFSSNDPLKKHTNLMYRTHKELVQDTLVDGYWNKLNKEIDSSFSNLSAIESAQRIRKNVNSKLDDPDLLRVVKSLVHMSFNRFFSFNQNIYEVIIYNMMSKHYKTELIKRKLA